MRPLLLVLSVAVMPVFLLAGFKILHTVLANQAMASVSEDKFEAGSLSDSERRHYAGLLRGQLAKDPLKIRDFDRQQILLLLNEPGLRRAEGSFHHWQYISDLCVLDIFLKDGNDAKAIQYVDFHPRRTAWYGTGKIPHATDTVDEKACLNSLETP